LNGQQSFIRISRQSAKLVRLPDAPDDSETYAYSLQEIETMLAMIPEPAATVCAVAAFAGLCRSELRGLRWEDYDRQQIHGEPSEWEAFTNDRKRNAARLLCP